MRPGDRVRVTEAYGQRWPSASDYIGEEGVVLAADGNWVRAALYCDGGPQGLFRPDELERVDVRRFVR